MQESEQRIDQALASLRRESGLVVAGRLGAVVRERLAARMVGVSTGEPSLQCLLEALSAPARPLFADVTLWRALRTEVVPLLRTYPSISLWVSGCGGGREVLALAVVLAEEGLAARARIYATDISDATVTDAARGFVDTAELANAVPLHAQTGARGPLAEYFRPLGKGYVLAPAVRERLVFGVHNPATDGPLNEFQLVLCRHLLGALEPAQEQRAYRLLEGSVGRLGVLVLAEGDDLAHGLASSFVPFGTGATRMLRNRTLPHGTVR